MSDNIIEIENLKKTFKTDKYSADALKDLNLYIKRGEIIGIIGFSGAGKSTLVRCINGLEKPDGGQIKVCGQYITELKHRQLIEIRRKIGMIFQNFNLLQQRSVLKNVLFPLEIAKTERQQSIIKAKNLLEEVGLSEKSKAYPSQLSGGQKQRVAIARALALDPEILLCDEATSALDPETTAQILKLLKEINEKYHITIVLISHQLNVVKSICNRVAVIESGNICEIGETDKVFTSPVSDAAKRMLAYEGGLI